MASVDAVVVGGGVVGLACSVALARRGLQVLALEAEPTLGTGISSRNSEVIHAGIYYPPGSLKAKLCVDGKHRLYDYCEKRGVPHHKLGKIIFAANDEEQQTLGEILERGRASGVDDLRPLSRGELQSFEPELPARHAIFSPSTGIVDGHALMCALDGELQSLGGQLVCNARLTRVTAHAEGWNIHVAGEDGAVLTTRFLINSAGLAAPEVASRIEGVAPRHVPQPLYARGCYFSYARKVPFSHLIYPVPVPGGLGTHLTLDLAGRARFGPNVEWIDTVDFTVDCSLHSEFLEAARKIWPRIDPEALRPDYAGVRPKVRTADGIANDFIISGPADHGCKGLVNLFGIESPGLTASLAIGEEVANRLDQAAA